MKKSLLLACLLTIGICSCSNDGDEIIDQEPDGNSDTSLATVDYSGLKLNEINGNGTDADKYIELYNSGTEAINLSEVTIYYNNASSDPEVTWTGTSAHSIAAGGFLLLKGASGSGNLIKGLSATKAIVVELKDPNGNSLDLFKVSADADRASVYSRVPDGTGSWYYTVVGGTPGATNGVSAVGLTEIVILPSVSSQSRNVVAPSVTDTVTISAEVVSLFGTTLGGVVVTWTLNGATQNDLPMSANGNIYVAKIMPQAVGDTVVYYIEATNENGSAQSSRAGYRVGATTVDYGQLVINEVDGNGKFVEIYNKGAAAISLEGVFLIKNEETAAKKVWWTGGASTTIAAGGYYTIVNKDATTAGANEYTGVSGISAKQNVKFELKNPSEDVVDTFLRLSIDGVLGDEITPDYSKAANGIYSFSRCPDGTGAFGLAVPSCNAANPATAAGDIVTN